MHNITKSVLVAALAAVATPVASFAGVPATATQNVPGLVNYQGRLQDPANNFANYADGIYTLDLRLYTAASGGTCIWGGQYKVYVKDGYFNLMLGDPNATDLTPQPKYKNTELWKALWAASSADATRYLSVTPHENARGATLSTFSEILPRQQLLSSPFAFSAQHAHYADYSNAQTFTCLTNLQVNGTSTLKGTVTFNGQIKATGATQTIGPVRTTSTSVNLGNGYTSATADNRSSLPQSVYDIGQYLYFYSYYSMNFKPTAGGVTFTVPSGYNMKMTGGGNLVSDLPVTTIGGTGNTTIKGSGVTITGTSSTSVKGSTLYLRAGGRVLLQPATNEFVNGQGELHWSTPSSPTLNSKKPFLRKTVVVVVPAGSRSVSKPITSSYAPSVNDYSWMYVGQYCTTGYDSALVDARVKDNTIVQISLRDTPTRELTFYIYVLGVNKNMLNDED